jgi:hypothetical protein
VRTPVSSARGRADAGWPAWLPRHRSAGSFRDAIRVYPLARRLPLVFSPARLERDLSAIDDDWWTPHLGPYHDGGWASVSLWAPRGDVHEQRSTGGAFAATCALASCPYITEVLNAFPGTRHRVRLMRLKAGGRILPHSDPLHTISPHLVRIHVPIVTAPEVELRVNRSRIPLCAGEAWTIDVRFRHQVDNRSRRDRVHLVVDLIRDPALDQLLARAEWFGRGVLWRYFVKHALPLGAKRWLKIGN